MGHFCNRRDSEEGGGQAHFLGSALSGCTFEPHLASDHQPLNHGLRLLLQQLASAGEECLQGTILRNSLSISMAAVPQLVHWKATVSSPTDVPQAGVPVGWPSADVAVLLLQ